jgi:hypothetical protein
MGALTCVLEDNTCFEAEMYADEYSDGADIEFKEDQRSECDTFSQLVHTLTSYSKSG